MSPATFAITALLLIPLLRADAAQSKTTPPTDKNHGSKRKAVVFNSKIVTDQKLVSAKSCETVDMAMLYTKEPRDAKLRAMDVRCRISRLPKAKAAKAPVPVLVQRPDGKAFFGTVDRDTLDKVADACAGLGKVIPSVMTDVSLSDATMISALSASSCKSLHNEMVKDNPLVVLGTFVVIDIGIANDLGDLLKQVPNLRSTVDLLQGLNNKVNDTLAEAAKKPVTWALQHPADALAFLPPEVALLGSKDQKEFTNRTIAYLNSGGVPIANLKSAAKQIGGPAGDLISKSIDTLPPLPKPIPDRLPTSGEAEDFVKRSLGLH